MTGRINQSTRKFPLQVGLCRSSFRPDGGGELQFLNYVRLFSELFYEVTVFTQYDISDVIADATGVDRRQVFNFQESQCFAVAVREKADQLGLDLLHSHEWIVGAESIRLGDGLHSSFLTQMRMNSRNINKAKYLDSFHSAKLKLERQAFADDRLRFLISPTQMVLDEAIERYPRVNARTQVIQNPINPLYLNAPIQKFLENEILQVLFVGSGWNRKGFSLLLNALAITKRPFLLTVVGNDKHSIRYQKLVHKLGIDSKIRWVGIQSNLEKYYSTADLLVLPAIYEPAGNVVAEALAMGVKVLVSHYVGYKELVTERSGEIVELSIEEIHLFVLLDL